MYSQVFGIDIFENLVRFYLNKSDAAFADYVYRYAKKAFSYSISLESGRGMLVYPRQNDSAKRRFFVDCLVANYNKTHQNHKVSINDAEKPLWVEFVDNPTLPTSAFVHVRFYADKVHFRVYNPNDDVSLAMSELTRRNLKLKPAQQVRLKITDANSLARLEFWIQSCLDNKIMKIIYNKEELVNMKAHFRQKSSWQTPVNNAFILKEHYQILDAKTNESFIAIQKRYRNLVKQYHPDNVYGKDEATVKSYTEKFRQVQCAFDAIRAYYEKAS